MNTEPATQCCSYCQEPFLAERMIGEVPFLLTALHVLTINIESVLTTAFHIGIDSNCHFDPSPERAQFLVLSASFIFIQRFCAVMVLYNSVLCV